MLFRGRLFSTYHLRDVLSNLKQTMFRAIDSLSEDELCSSLSEDGLKQLVGKYTVSTPQIDELGIYSETRAPKVVIRNLFRNGSDEEGTSVDESGTRVLVHVPFTGNPELFECRPSNGPHTMPRAVVSDSELVFDYEGLREGGKSLSKAFERDFNHVKQWLAWMARDLEEFNSSIRESAKQSIRARNDKFLRDRRIAESLGFPIRRATDLAGTSEAPTVEPDVALPPPAVPQELEAPQPPSDFPAIEHSPGYKMLIVDGQKLRMRPMAVRTIHFIYTEWMRTGNPDVDEETVLNNIPTQQDSLYKAVRHGRRRIWNEMIRRGNAKGTVRLILSAFAKNA